MSHYLSTVKRKALTLSLFLITAHVIPLRRDVHANRCSYLHVLSAVRWWVDERAAGRVVPTRREASVTRHFPRLRASRNLSVPLALGGTDPYPLAYMHSSVPVSLRWALMAPSVDCCKCMMGYMHLALKRS